MSGEDQADLTPRAQQALAFARTEAERLHNNFVGTEHLLLGLIKLGTGVAIAVLQRLGVDLEAIRLEMEKTVGIGPDYGPGGYIPSTPRFNAVLALAKEEARSLRHAYLGTEHLLLGLLREGNGVAARVLKNLDVTAELVRPEILEEVNPDLVAETYAQASSMPNAPAKSMSSHPASIDTTKRYDVYCSERNDGGLAVYRNVLFIHGVIKICA